MNAEQRFEDQIQLALEQRLVGWDFSWLNQHSQEAPLPWDYRQLVVERLKNAASLLDLGTGGGEFLASLAPLPADTCATEGYAPNVRIARQRLEPFGVQVADMAAYGLKLPFEAKRFDLVIDRHEGVDLREVARVLKPGGRFLTQQVGGSNCFELNQWLQEKPETIYGDATLQREVEMAQRAGLRILQAHEAFPTLTFLDTAGVIFYLNAIPWQIEDFSVDAYREALFRLHQKIEEEGELIVHEHRYLLEAEK
jgi:SAM-dependent methyltransferase